MNGSPTHLPAWRGAAVLCLLVGVGCGGDDASPAGGLARPAEACDTSRVLDLPIEGFGEGTVGGFREDAGVVCVTSLADDGPGTFREAARTFGEPRIVRFAVDGVIDLASPISLPSNFTVDGRGRDVSFRGKGFVIHGKHQVILTHVAIVDVGPTSEDGIQIGTVDEASGYVVLDHLRFAQTTGEGSSDHVDEAISIIYGSHHVTVQHCRFEDWEKVILAGNGDAEPDVDRAISLTVHHNVFDGTGRRHPRGRWGQFDVYNNVFYDWHMYDWAGPPGWHLSDGSKCGEGCRMRLEQNLYQRHRVPQDAFSDANKASLCEYGGEITDRGRWIHPDNTEPLRFGVHCREGDWERPYTATVETAGPELWDRILAEAGNLP